MLFNITNCIFCKSKLYNNNSNNYCNNYYCYSSFIIREDIVEIRFNKNIFNFNKSKKELFYSLNCKNSNTVHVNSNIIYDIDFESFDDFYKKCNTIIKLELFQ